MRIEYIDRKIKKICIEKVYGSIFIKFLYSTIPGFHFVRKMAQILLTKNALFSKCYGYLQTTRFSRYKIAPFLRKYEVDISEFEPKKYLSFNDFFIRKLNLSKRKIIQDPRIAIAPADGRYLVFPNLAKDPIFFIKEKEFDVARLVSNDAYYQRYKTGSMVIARLCPSDYHRFHFIDDGVLKSCDLIEGYLQSVNPFAWRKNLEIFWTNKREISEFCSENFGAVLVIEIGATCVGTIHQTAQISQKVKKGDEKGYFSFGGSCIILLFEKDRIVFDQDLLENSENGFETKINFGESLGKVYVV